MIYVDRRHRRAGLHRLGPSHVPERHGPAPGHRLHGRHHHDRPAVGREGLQLAGHRLQGQHPVHLGRCSSPWPSCRCSSSAASAASSWPRRRWTSTSTTPTSSSAHIHYVLFTSSLFGIFAAIYLLVPEDVWPDDERTLGQGPFRLDVHRRQLRLLPDAHPRRGRPAAPHRRHHRDGVRRHAAGRSTSS